MRRRRVRHASDETTTRELPLGRFEGKGENHARPRSWDPLELSQWRDVEEMSPRQRPEIERERASTRLFCRSRRGKRARISVSFPPSEGESCGHSRAFCSDERGKKTLETGAKRNSPTAARRVSELYLLRSDLCPGKTLEPESSSRSRDTYRARRRCSRAWAGSGRRSTASGRVAPSFAAFRFLHF